MVPIVAATESLTPTTAKILLTKKLIIHCKRRIPLMKASIIKPKTEIIRKGIAIVKSKPLACWIVDIAEFSISLPKLSCSKNDKSTKLKIEFAIRRKKVKTMESLKTEKYSSLPTSKNPIAPSLI
jgi:hypothetical protein